MQMSTACSDAEQIPRQKTARLLPFSREEQLTQPDSISVGVEAYACSQLFWRGCTWRNTRLIGTKQMRLQFPDPELTHVAFLLENEAARAQFRMLPETQVHVQSPKECISLVPAGAAMWVCSEQGGPLEFSSMAFDIEAMSQLFGETISCAALSTPLVNFSHPRIWQYARHIAEESRASRELCGLYCESMVLTLLIEVLRLASEGGNPRTWHSTRRGLSQRQLRLATECIEQNLNVCVSLRDLAELTGLSISHFSHAFKHSTGKPPHRWQLEARIRLAKKLLASTLLPLSSVATETGFADQSHFTRVFRRLEGVTPRAWRSSQICQKIL